MQVSGFSHVFGLILAGSCSIIEVRILQNVVVLDVNDILTDVMSGC